MENAPHVLLLGNSVFMDGIAESLLGHQQSVVTRVNTNIEEVGPLLPSITPDLIIYELGSSANHPIFALMNEQAEISHLAIDLKSKLVFLYHCKTGPTGSMQELCDFVSDEIAFKNRKKKELKTALVE